MSSVQSATTVPDDEIEGGPGVARAAARRSSLRLAVVVGAVVAVACVIVANEVAPGDDEPLVLRWIRTCALHPVRTGLGWALITIALTPPRPLDAEPKASVSR